MQEEYEAWKNDLFCTKVLKKIRLIKEGEFPRLYKNDFDNEISYSDVRIPEQQIKKFKMKKQKDENFKMKKEFEDRSLKKDSQMHTKLTGIDEILANRPKLNAILTAENEIANQSTKKGLEATASEKIRDGTMKAWVDRCYNFIHKTHLVDEKNVPSVECICGSRPCNCFPILENRNREIRLLLEWDRRPLGVENVLKPNETIRKKSDMSLDRDPSSMEERSSSDDISERILRMKMGSIPREPTQKIEEVEVDPQLETEQSGVNSVLAEYYIRDLQELESLSFNEELYAFHPEKGIVGSWSVDVKVCENDQKCVNVQFEGLLEDDDRSYAMYTAGIVDRKFSPSSEFRVEQVNTPNESRARTMFYLKKGGNWLFNLRESVNNTETKKNLTLNYQQMVRVVSEGAHILLMRKIVMYYHPVHIGVLEGDVKTKTSPEFCPCSALTGSCLCEKSHYEFRTKNKFNFKMRSLCIGGDVCRTNYRFYSPVNIKYNCVLLNVVRIRRRIEMPGNLTQTSNFYMTTAGQLMAVTFNDPYPYDTPFWLQVDPKAVLHPQRVVPPERIVPLRERYMFDPVLKQFYEDEVDRQMAINKTYLLDQTAVSNGLKALLQDLLNDKPHRVLTFIQNFFFEGYKFRQRWSEQEGENLKKVKKSKLKK